MGKDPQPNILNNKAPTIKNHMSASHPQWGPEVYRLGDWYRHILGVLLKNSTSRQFSLFRKNTNDRYYHYQVPSTSSSGKNQTIAFGSKSIIKHNILVRKYFIQQLQGTILLMVFDLKEQYRKKNPANSTTQTAFQVQASNRFFTARYMALCDKANLRFFGRESIRFFITKHFRYLK